MDFSTIELDEAALRFQAEVRELVRHHVTDTVRAEQITEKDDFDLSLHRALGERGWIMAGWAAEDGGAALGHLERTILELELARADAPRINLSTTRMSIPAVVEHGSRALRELVIARAVRGDVRISLGYTEPHGGSDIASARTSARLDGDDWVINGTKVYTTGAHHCDYSLLITRTDPTASRPHLGLTMFLMPMDVPGVDIRPLWTLGERTNTVYFADARIPDLYRLGEVNDGWNVLSGPLAAEHAAAAMAGRSPEDVVMNYCRRLAHALALADTWARSTVLRDGTRPIDHPHTVEVLTRVAASIATARVTDGMVGRVVSAETYLASSELLLDLVGPGALLPGLSPESEILRSHYRAHITTVFGGTVEVFRNMLAQQLGLPRWDAAVRARPTVGAGL
jgi:alkylation response protein AidB-like acyl-CoA dehydrogenase